MNDELGKRGGFGFSFASLSEFAYIVHNCVHLPLMKIIIASTRAAKIDAAHLAIARIAAIDSKWRAAEIFARKVDTSAPAMPLSDEEMMTGARQRAHGAREIWRRENSLTKDDELILGVGLEGGLHTLAHDGARQTFLRGWACVADGSRVSFGASGSILVPRAIVERVVGEGRELGEVIDEAAGERDVRSKQGAWGVLSRDLITRAMSFETALVAALAPFYNEIYHKTGDRIQESGDRRIERFAH